MNSRRLIRFPRAEDVIVPCRVALFRRAQAIAGGVLTHPRRGAAHRREHRQAAGAAAGEGRRLIEGPAACFIVRDHALAETIVPVQDGR